MPFIASFWRAITGFLIFIVFIIFLFEVVFVEFCIFVYFFGGGEIVETTAAVINDLDVATLDVFVVDGFIDVKEKQCGVIPLKKIALGEVEDSSAIDEEEELDLLIHLGFLDAGKQLGVPSDRVDLVLDILAFEKFLRGVWNTDKILSVHSESMSTAQKRTTETWAMFISSWIFSKRTMMSLS